MMDPGAYAPRLAGVLAFWISRGDEAEVAVEDVNQLVEIARPLHVAGGGPELVAGTHVALDVGADVGKQRFEDGLGGFLVEAMRRSGAGAGEGLFEKGDADSLGAADLFERGRRPGFAFHHLGE